MFYALLRLLEGLEVMFEKATILRDSTFYLKDKASAMLMS